MPRTKKQSTQALGNGPLVSRVIPAGPWNAVDASSARALAPAPAVPHARRAKLVDVEPARARGAGKRDRSERQHQRRRQRSQADSMNLRREDGCQMDSLQGRLFSG